MVNCRSIVNKIDEFAGLVESLKADIVFGTESWLNPSITDSEVFPCNYTAYRNDRPGHGGGVFLLVHSSLSSSMLNIGHDSVESVWCTVTLANNLSFVTGAFYRPPSTDFRVLKMLYDIVSEASGQIILLAGDFNLPDLKWDNGTCELMKASRTNLEMKNLADSFGFFQYVLEPTRINSTLDLLFCNSPNLVGNVDIIPGISDHRVVVAGIKTKVQRTKRRISRRVFFFEKGDYSSISDKLLDFLPVFECFAEEHEVEYLWSTFRKKLLDLTEKFIPSIESARLQKRKKPWITFRVLKLVKKRRHEFQRYKRTKTHAHFKRLQELTREYKSLSKKAKEQYLKRLNDKMKTNPKPFWQYLKGCGSDPVGINEIIYNERTLSDDAEKATCLNRYFQSVFLSQSACSPQSSNSNVPLMQPIELSISGIESLLKNLDESKAIGPDGISPRILKQCAHAG